MRTITGTFMHGDEEFEYIAEIAEDDDYRPDKITSLDMADGSLLSDRHDFETLEEIAMNDALKKYIM